MEFNNKLRPKQPLDIKVSKQPLNHKGKNLARDVYHNKKLNDRYDVDYFSDDSHIHIRDKQKGKTK